MAMQSVPSARWVRAAVGSLGIAGLLALSLLARTPPAAPVLAAAAALLGLAVLAWWLMRLLEAERSAHETRLALNQAILDTLQIGLVHYDRDDRLTLTNRDFRALYQAFEQEWKPGRTFESMLRQAVDRGAVPEAAERPEQWIDQRLAQHRRPGPPFVRQMADGRWRRITEQRLEDGSLLAHSVDITDLVQREQELQRLNERLDALNGELEHLSQTDALTGLGNRRQFDRRLATEWSHAQRHGLPLSLVMLDVDHFKRFNDRRGHPAGDACLREVAALLRGVARRPTDLVARVGGEEFAILLPHQDGAEAELVARRCLQALAQAAIEHGDSPVSPVVTLSIGIGHAGAAHSGAQADALLAAADAALYRAKREGRARCVLAPPL